MKHKILQEVDRNSELRLDLSIAIINVIGGGKQRDRYGGNKYFNQGAMCVSSML